ncbi:MAG: hypothetical protein K5655_01220 [Lachnospiraceae bacterium]|jgi:hypothetical protein|nr:hypothetical protein [Lachnospiraceae bacterium]
MRKREMGPDYIHTKKQKMEGHGLRIQNNRKKTVAGIIIAELQKERTLWES